MKKLALPLALVAAIVLGGMAAKSADAATFRVSFGTPVVYSGYGYGQTSCYGGNVYYGGGTRWHDTSHYDYHPAGIERHGNHFHYVPAHLHLYQTGHWDYYPW